MLMKKARLLILVPLLLPLMAQSVFGWFRMPVNDVQLAERSRLIVVGYVDPASITFVPHDTEEYGKSFHHTAILKIQRILKGTSEETEIPIIIHYGLTPAINGKADQKGYYELNLDWMIPDYDTSGSSVQLFDHGSGFGVNPNNIASPCLWFLQRRTGQYGSECHYSAPYGIKDPEEVQALGHESFYKGILQNQNSAFFEALIQNANEDTLLLNKAYLYIQKLELDRLGFLCEEAKAKKIMSMYLEFDSFRYDRYGYDLHLNALNQCSCCKKQIAKEGITSLLKPNEYPSATSKRVVLIDFIGLWRDQEAVPLLIGILEKQNLYWEKQVLHKDWWKDYTNKKDNAEQRTRYHELVAVIRALSRIKPAEEIPALYQTKKYWSKQPYPNQPAEESRKLIQLIKES